MVARKLRHRQGRDHECMRTLSRYFTVLGLLCAAILAAPVCAQEYPSKAVRIVVSFAPDGPNDLSVRPVAQKLQEILGQPRIVRITLPAV